MSCLMVLLFHGCPNWFMLILIRAPWRWTGWVRDRGTEPFSEILPWLCLIKGRRDPSVLTLGLPPKACRAWCLRRILTAVIWLWLNLSENILTRWCLAACIRVSKLLLLNRPVSVLSRPFSRMDIRMNRDNFITQNHRLSLC